MHCPVTRKRSFLTEDMALEALFQNHIRNNYHTGQGPINVYLCEECGDWHFTSKGEMHPTLSDSLDNGDLKAERDAFFWEQKFKGRF